MSDVLILKLSIHNHAVVTYFELFPVLFCGYSLLCFVVTQQLLRTSVPVPSCVPCVQPR